jgi:outer membrane lipoprotein-sorting protein
MRVLIGFLSLSVFAADSADRIIERHLAARGGIHRLHALRSQRLSGKLSFAPNLPEPFAVEMKRPHLMRQELTLQGNRMVQITDGAQGWTLRADKPPEPMPAEQARAMADGGDLEGPLLDYRAKGNSVEYGGKVNIENRPAHKLIITLKNGDKRVDYVDAKTYLELKWEGTVGGQKMESVFRDYRKVKGIAYAFLIESRGATFEQRLAFDTIEVDVDLPNSRFERP